jgi:hypothetical protein
MTKVRYWNVDNTLWPDKLDCPMVGDKIRSATGKVRNITDLVHDAEWEYNKTEDKYTQGECFIMVTLGTLTDD